MKKDTKLLRVQLIDGVVLGNANSLSQAPSTVFRVPDAELKLLGNGLIEIKKDGRYVWVPLSNVQYLIPDLSDDIS